ncbi:unnamed protein product [Lactuca saligna]|uniref:Uncharacterized protein n=1 Tax=Lactuca saligna TaxID=75948 RepID=A0AA35Z301_LACSI|nr:unnamed protein product [Lactuca saligna]
MEALEFMDLDMLDVVNKCPIAAIHQASSDGASGSKLKGKLVLGFNKEEKRMLNLNVKERTGIGKSLPFYVYRLVQNYSTTQEMMITQSSDFEKENSSDDECTCLMAQIVEPHTETDHDNIEILDADQPYAAKDLKSEWDDTLVY